jgi:hypothetical protein
MYIEMESHTDKEPQKQRRENGTRRKKKKHGPASVM